MVAHLEILFQEQSYLRLQFGLLEWSSTQDQYRLLRNHQCGDCAVVDAVIVDHPMTAKTFLNIVKLSETLVKYCETLLKQCKTLKASNLPRIQ